VRQQLLGRGYPVFSWFALMAGMGVFPDAQDLRAPSADEARYRMEEIDNLIHRSAGNFPDHKSLLAHIPPRRRAPALQAYFW
jgi:hypothetical protein